MTTANVTGSTPKTFNLDIITLPSQSVDIQDLVHFSFQLVNRYLYLYVN
jgi:hypothetical protein